jgi:hypothetical protein
VVRTAASSTVWSRWASSTAAWNSGRDNSGLLEPTPTEPREDEGLWTLEPPLRRAHQLAPKSPQRERTRRTLAPKPRTFQASLSPIPPWRWGSKTRIVRRRSAYHGSPIGASAVQSRRKTSRGSRLRHRQRRRKRANIRANKPVPERRTQLHAVAQEPRDGHLDGMKCDGAGQSDTSSDTMELPTD